MSLVQPHSRAKSANLSAIVTRADGRVEDLGLVAYWHKNPIIRWSVNLYIWLKERIRS